jgi:Leucine-rich repeat (LRR) protein
MSIVAGFKSLQYLDVTETKISIASAPYIGSLTKLEEVYLYQGNDILPEQAFSYFGALTQLKEFTLIFPRRLANDGVSELLKNTMDRWIRWNCAMEPGVGGRWRYPYDPDRVDHPLIPAVTKGRDVLNVIHGMTRFHELELDIASCEDEDLSLLDPLKNIEVLNLTGSHLTGKGLEHLQRLQQLKYLNLTDTHLGKRDLLALKSCPRLTDVLVTDCKLSTQDVRDLENEMPRVRFIPYRCPP